MCACLSVCVPHMGRQPWGEKAGSRRPDLESQQPGTSHGVLGTELRSSERAANILNCESFFQYLLVLFCVCSFETRSHVGQGSLEFTKSLKLTLNS